jgi:hypothetical protein
VIGVPFTLVRPFDSLSENRLTGGHVWRNSLDLDKRHGGNLQAVAPHRKFWARGRVYVGLFCRPYLIQSRRVALAQGLPVSPMPSDNDGFLEKGLGLARARPVHCAEPQLMSAFGDLYHGPVASRRPLVAEHQSFPPIRPSFASEHSVSDYRREETSCNGPELV